MCLPLFSGTIVMGNMLVIENNKQNMALNRILVFVTMKLSILSVDFKALR
jgi:hypothetical protein